MRAWGVGGWVDRASNNSDEKRIKFPTVKIRTGTFSGKVSSRESESLNRFRREKRSWL